MGDSQTATLPHGKPIDPQVSSQTRTVLKKNRPGPIRLIKKRDQLFLDCLRMVPNESAVISIGNKTDLLAVRLARRRQAVGPGDFTNARLFVLTHGKLNMGELFLCKLEQIIGLVFAQTLALEEHITLLWGMANTRIVPRGDPIDANFPGENQELIELQKGIAQSTGNRGPPGQIIIDERFYNPLFELLLQVENVKRKTHLLSNSSSIIDIVQRAAPSRLRLPIIRRITAVIPKLHRAADDVITLVFQQNSRRGTVYTTTHGQ